MKRELAMTTATIRLAVGFCIATILAWPSATAWTLDIEETEPATPAVEAWTQIAPAIGAPTPYASGATKTLACALGDVNGDGAADLLVLVQDTADGPLLLKALAGPDFAATLWQIPTTAQRALECAPDLNRDALPDPVTTLGPATATDSGPVADQSVERAMQVLDGATGQSLMHRQHEDTHRGAGSSSGATGASANSTTAANLLPAAAGAEAYLKTEVQHSGITGLPQDLPLSSLTSSARQTAEMQLLNAQGAVVGTVTVDTPDMRPLAMAPLPAGLGLPDVAVLTTKATSAVDQANQHMPTLSRYNPDGSLAWSVDLEATQGVPTLVPRAGDLNMDGVQEMIVSNVPAGVQATASGKFQVLSGLDGDVLFDSGAAVDGMMAALPLGSLPDGTPALVAVEQLTAAENLTITALEADGSTHWSVDLAAGSIPINVRQDAYTGDPIGFTDLTADGVPDVAAAVPVDDGMAVTAVDGATGSVSWSTTIEGAARIVPFSPNATLTAVASTTATVPGDLMAVGNGTAGPLLTLVDGHSGQVVWHVTAAASAAGEASVDVDVQAAGDIDADGIQDALVTTARGQGADAEQAIYVLSGADGSTIWANATQADQVASELINATGPAFAGTAAAADDEEDGGDSPGISVAWLIPAFAVLAVILRPRGGS